MKINFVLPYAGIKGGIRVIAIYAQLLAERGHEVYIISQPKRAKGLKSLITSSLRPQKQASQPFTFFDNTHPNVSHRVLSRPRPVKDSDLPDADVTVATWWETAQWVAQLSPAKGAKAYFMQDYGAPGQSLENLIPTWRLPLHLITISPWLSELIDYCVNRESDIAFNGVDLSGFPATERFKQSQPTVGLLYRRAHMKGADVMLNAISLARKEIPNLKVKGFGALPPASKIDEVENGEFQWMAAESEIPKIYAQCDCWLFGTRREGFGLPILEAFACGTPVVATPAGAAKAILNHGGGKLVAHENAEEMATALVDILRLPEQSWRELSTQARLTAERFTWSNACDQFESGLLNALSQPNYRTEQQLAT